MDSSFSPRDFLFTLLLKVGVAASIAALLARWNTFRRVLFTEERDVDQKIKLMMAAPLAFCLALLGGSLGYGIQAAHWGRRHAPAMLGIVLLFTPGFYGVEHFTRPQPGVFEVKSTIEIDAPPEKVWQKVVAFTEIPPPKETIFRAGVAYPIRAEIAGHGPGAVRHCVFSTGSFVEPITVWDEPHLLRFSVTENPAPMNELTPYGHIEPKHLHGYFESHQGQFLLTELPGGRTRVEGTTWYSHSMGRATGVLSRTGSGTSAHTSG